MNNSEPPFQFSILRLAIALCVFGIPFAFFAHKGEKGILLSIVIGGALAGLALILGRQDRYRILNLLICAAIGGAVSMLLAPDVSYADRHQTAAGAWTIRGIAIGCILGWIWNLATRPD